MLYDIGFLIFSLFYLPTLIFKGKLHKDFLERFGVYDAAKCRALAASKGAIWIQAVSVGEVSACKSLITGLRADFPDKKIIISTITKTGNDLARKLFSNDALIIYFPLDFSFIVKKIAALIKPCIYIMVETEIWPNFLREMAHGGIPSVIINGRISDRSFGNYMLARRFLKDTLAGISLFCMQSDLDRQRIISMGAPKTKVMVSGNMKFDIDIKADLKTMEILKEMLSLKADEELFVAGSTHRGEEVMVVESFKELLKDFPRLKLLIAPRHIERVSEVRAEVARSGLDVAHVFILDRIGYLTSAYSFATLVFVGGSLVGHGGQNPIEPAIFEKAILFGPNMFNFKDISRVFLENRAAIQVSDAKGLIEASKMLLKDRRRRDELGKKARETVVSGRGATKKNLDAIKGLV